MPNSVSFWTTHSGRSPLTGAKATVRAGSARASDSGAVATDDRRRPERLERPPPRQAVPCPASEPVGGDDLLAIAQPQDPSQVVRVLVGEDRLAGVVHEDLAGRGRPHGEAA